MVLGSSPVAVKKEIDEKFDAYKKQLRSEYMKLIN